MVNIIAMHESESPFEGCSEVCNHEFIQCSWVCDGSDVPFMFDEKTALDAYGCKCR